MRRGILVRVLVGLTLAGLVFFLIVSTDADWNVVGVLMTIFGGLFAIGLVIRFIRAKPGNRLRETFGPIVDAGDVYQKLLMNRPTTDESLREASKYISRDKYSSEE